MGELVASRATLTNESPPDKTEHNWFQDLDPCLLTRSKNQTKHYSSWEIRLEEKDFIKWRSSLEKHILLVDGASKGNLRKAGGGGVLLDPSGRIILSFAWGLGHSSNNIAEILVLWKGLSQARRSSISNLAVIGDSRVIIQALTHRKTPKNFSLTHYYKKILILMVEFKKIEYYHILRKLNHLVDHEANVGACLRKGVIIVNGNENLSPIP